jgi:GTP-binding protein Era
MTENDSQKCGVVAVIGAPNAGKSTLVNSLVGQKVAITSPKAQTTRTRMLGIAIWQNIQVLLVDTPGVFEPKRKLDRSMVLAAWEGTKEADTILLVVDAVKQRWHELEPLIDALQQRPEPVILVINKVDIANKGHLLELAEKINFKTNVQEIHFVSARSGEGIDLLKETIKSIIPFGPWHYPEDQVSNISERMLATEITREQLYLQLHDELPYDSAVRPESYKHRQDGSVEIRQQIVVTRDSQRPIVLGKGGSKIRAIGEAARKELTEILGIQVHLFLHVKVDDWSENREIYEEIGLEWVK